jgi:hypothetical protein
MEQRAADAGAAFEAAVARASDKLAAMSEDAVGHADRLMQEMSGQMDEAGAALDRVASAMAGQMAQVTQNAGQEAHEMTEAAASEMAQTAQALGASVSIIQQQTGSMTADLREQAYAFAAISQASIEQVDAASERLHGFADDLTAAGESADDEHGGDAPRRERNRRIAGCAKPRCAGNGGVDFGTLARAG